MTPQPRVLPGIGHLDTLANTSTLAFDTETTGLMPTYGGLRLIQLAGPGTDIVVIDCWELEEHDWFTLEQFFAQERTWIAHNAVFDLGWLQVHGIHLQGKVICTMLASRLHRNGVIGSKHGLAACAQYYFKEQVDKTQQTSDWSQPTLAPEQIEYASKDAVLVLRLWDALLPRLTQGALLPALALECSALPALAALNRTGMPFDRDSLVALEQSYTQEIQALGERFVHDLDAALPPGEKLPRLADGAFNLNAKATGSVRQGNKVPAGFNLGSPKQLLHKLTVLLGEAPLSPKTGKPSTDKAALRGYAADSEVVQTYLAWKRAEKRRQMVRALVDHLDADGFVKAQYIQLGADTGRMSCRTPNLQQVPRDKGFRNAAKSPPGWKFVVADFGQMELRLAAAVSKDKRMIEAFQAGEDLHAVTAQAIYAEPSDDKDVLKARRQVSKSANFGLLYGSGAKGLRDYAGSMGITMTLDEAKEIRDKFHATYTGISTWQQQCGREADKTKGNKWAQVLIPGSGLRRYLPGDLNRITTRCNTPIQGAGAAVLKLALANLWPHLRQAGEDKVRLVGVVHDEIALLVRDGLEEKWCQTLSQVMEEAESRWLGDIPPLAEAAWGDSWGEAK